jgi:hypothetical protein
MYGYWLDGGTARIRPNISVTKSRSTKGGFFVNLQPGFINFIAGVKLIEHSVGIASSTVGTKQNVPTVPTERKG